ncbi:uncharacterized protein METZ01_LOCUS123408, partial [marine metagenome]
VFNSQFLPAFPGCPHVTESRPVSGRPFPGIPGRPPTTPSRRKTGPGNPVRGACNLRLYCRYDRPLRPGRSQTPVRPLRTGM